MFKPEIHYSDDTIAVVFQQDCRKSRKLQVECVLDFNGMGDVIGIEILNLKLQAGRDCLRSMDAAVNSLADDLEFSYDDSTDSFYLRLSPDRSLDQAAVLGTLELNVAGEIVALSASVLYKNDSNSK
ncbi:MAG: hypothetical protein DWQ35_20410 [Planctomycetota bacterium]|nr:MAG: hypothetical protein DWQ35_20410 [Planctomycetota bacterium]REK27107.1 MAG: hypothetical protein DWQ42_07670 [Planctomycetota bacterium]REK38245.1 MAG: hypothetical protein DWQ46_20760 [Planctomycetota bacterium]